jgi:hypothetical protein
MAVHQNHDYGYHPQSKQGVFYEAEAGRNYELAGGWKHLRTIADATERLRKDELGPNRLRHWASVKRYARQTWGASAPEKRTNQSALLAADRRIGETHRSAGGDEHILQFAGRSDRHTSTDAIRTFFSSGMDALVMGNFLVEK